jgi:hypothetical protein
MSLRPSITAVTAPSSTPARFQVSLVLGVAGTALVWGGFALLVAPRLSGWVVSPLGYAYNIPITLPFLVLAAELALSLRTVSLRRNTPYALVWAIGLVQLFLRVGLDVIPVSGHLTWLVLMLAHSWRRGWSKWFVALVGLILVQAAYFNIVIFGQQQYGVNGLLFGSLLALVLVGLDRYLNPGTSPRLSTSKM